MRVWKGRTGEQTFEAMKVEKRKGEKGGRSLPLVRHTIVILNTPRATMSIFYHEIPLSFP